MSGTFNTVPYLKNDNRLGSMLRDSWNRPYSHILSTITKKVFFKLRNKSGIGGAAA